MQKNTCQNSNHFSLTHIFKKFVFLIYFQRFSVQLHFYFASHNEGDNHCSFTWMAMDSYQKHFGIGLGQGWPQRKKKMFSANTLFLNVKWSYSSVGIIPDSKVVGEEQVIKIPGEQVTTFFFLPFSSVCLPLGGFFHLQAAGASSPRRGFPQLHRTCALILQCLPWLRANCACMLKQHFS